MKRAGFVIVLVLAILSLMLAGCGGGDDNGDESKPTATVKPGTTATATAKPGTTATAKPGTTATPKPTEKPSGDLGDLLSGMQAVKSVKYDMVITAPGAETMTGTAWWKPDTGMKIKSTVQGITTYMIINYDKEVMYSYMPDQNMAIKMPWSYAPETGLEDIEDLEQWDPKIVGSETIDGKKCVIVEYSAEGATTRMWVWEDKSFPLKVEVTSTEGKTVMEYKNIDFSNISDSEFELPAGVQIQQMPG